MKSNALEYNTWDDIVFDSRNKRYGAYIIRKLYNSYVMFSALIAVSIFLFFMGLPFFISLIMGKHKEEEKVYKTVKYTDLAPPPPIDKNTPPPPKLDLPPPVQKVIKFVPPKVTEQQVADEDPLPTQDEIKNNQTGTENIEGDENVEFTDTGNEAIGVGNGDQIYTFVEQAPEFPGGQQELMKYIAKNIRYPESARRMGVEGTVYISFVINKEGKVSDIQVMKGISKDCDEEATRVIGTLPDWKPGKQNGMPVLVRFSLPIRFKLQ
jgi:protein TonB